MCSYRYPDFEVEAKKFREELAGQASYIFFSAMVRAVHKKKYLNILKPLSCVNSKKIP
jgi:hypothetical protein